MSARRKRLHGERGQVAGIEVLPFALVVFVAGGLLVTNLWGVVDAKFATDAAAREAARYIAESADADTDPALVRQRATVVALGTLADHGRTSGTADVTFSPDGALLVRCQRIQVTVRSVVPAIRIPFVGGFGEGFDVTASHAELVDPTRSGVGGRAGCIR